MNKMKQVSVLRPVGFSVNIVLISLFMLYCSAIVSMLSLGGWVDVAEVVRES